ncbi:MAG TPA: D-alanyl-D-alanine carboxypeptidase/D-alanyl-D-alanine-endopeptidase [Gemmatimonadales bacterium]|nr:D-alanyl-D-alanine carboxypeptidase/D-alanyl-D-alanine-endopeptidase [Gemmatimonadales bacterium]
MVLARIRSTILAVIVAAGLPAGMRAQTVTVAPSRALTDQLNHWFARAARSAPGQWGIAVAGQDGQLIWGIEPTRPMIPASTVKLFTTGYARSVLGADARKRTRVLGIGHVDEASGTWMGTWALELNGDPTLERSARGGPSLVDLALKLRDAGVRRLVGPLVVVTASGSPGAAYPAAWSPRHRGRIFAPLIGQLTLNENVLSFTVAPGSRVGQRAVLVGESPAGVGELVDITAKTSSGRRTKLRYSLVAGGHYVVSGVIGIRARSRTFSTPVADPRAMLEASWARALHQSGIEWQRASGLAPTSSVTAQTTLAEVSSEPFDSIASEINRRSLNIGAELLLRWAGGEDSPADRLTSHVQEITGDFTSIHLVDGSGLSHDDRASPLAFVSYLARFPSSPGGRGFPQLLPANGTGTLRKLAKGLPGPGVVRAKTGTLGDVATLSGYLGRTEGVLLISLMYNGPRVWAARQEQWRLFRLLGAEGVILPIDSMDANGQLGGDNREPPTTTP